MAKKKLKHETHPELEFDPQFTCWECKKYLAWLEDDLYLTIYADTVGPSRQQLRLYKQIVSRRHSLRKNIELLVFDHYQNRVYGTGFCVVTAEGEYEPVPNLEESQQIWELMSIIGVTIDEMEDESDFNRFMIDLSFDWDDEHGAGVEMEEWQIRELEW